MAMAAIRPSGVRLAGAVKVFNLSRRIGAQIVHPQVLFREAPEHSNLSDDGICNRTHRAHVALGQGS
jgi:hypothetical protein